MKNGLMHVLLAANNDNERIYFKGALENLKMKTVVKTFTNGDELLQYLSVPHAESPNMLILGKKIPGTLGYEYLQLLKNFDSIKDTPIAIYSESPGTTANEIENSFVEGVNVYIQKPNNLQAFKKKLENVLATSWHYQSSGLNRDNFIMSL